MGLTKKSLTCKHGKNSVNRVTGQMNYRLKWVILNELKISLGQSGCGLSRVGFTHIFHMKYFYKEKIMYLLFGKSCNKLLDVECITLNSPLISRMNSIKFINTYSIILKLYKS